MNKFMVATVRKVVGLNMSVQLLIILIATILFGDLLPMGVKSFFFSTSVFLKECLLFVLPIVIFGHLFSCLINIQSKKTLALMFLLFGIICVSNYFSTLVAYSIGIFKITNMNLVGVDLGLKSELLPLFSYKLPQLLSNQQGLILGLLLGSIFSFFPNNRVSKYSDGLQKVSNFFIEKFFIPLLPVFSFGFILKMQHDGVLDQIVKTSLPLISIIVATSIVYLLFLFSVAANFNYKKFISYLKNVLPVGIMGFSTMSSLATMPLTLKAAEKNTNDVDVSRLVIPTASNVHLVGDSIAIPLVALSLLLGFGNEFPSFAVYSLFAIYFALAKFSVAAVPGGGILVMLPVLEQYLGFTDEMLNIITALYIVFDPVVTVINVLGNSVLVILIAKMFKKLSLVKKYLGLMIANFGIKAKYFLKRV